MVGDKELGIEVICEYHLDPGYDTGGIGYDRLWLSSGVRSERA